MKQFATQYGTPLYVYDGDQLTERCHAFRSAFHRKDTRFFFAVKANFNPALLKLIFAAGFGADVVSGGELTLARKLGLPASHIVFSGVGKTVAELKLAMDEGIHAIQIESAFEWRHLEKLGAVAKQTRLSLRVNLDIDAHTHRHITTSTHANKFGVPAAEAEALAKEIKNNGGNLVGLSCHLGSQIKEAAPFSGATRALSQLAGKFPGLEFVSLGGGLGIAYEPGEATLSLTDYASAIEPLLAKGSLRLHLEPGRWIVGPCGRLVTEVIGIKPTDQQSFVVVDAGMNDLIRPALYEAYHRITVATSSAPSPGAPQEVTVVGPVCESADTFAVNRRIPEVREGDLLVIENAGAYGMSMASNYNARPRPAEILVTGGKTKEIRRRETIDDFIL